MMSTSAFQHPTSKSGTEAFRYRRLVPAWAFFFLTVPDSPDAGQSGAFRIYKNWTQEDRGAPCSSTVHRQWVENYTPCTSTLLTVERDTTCMHVHTAALYRWIHPASPYYTGGYKKMSLLADQ